MSEVVAAAIAFEVFDERPAAGDEASPELDRVFGIVAFGASGVDADEGLAQRFACCAGFGGAGGVFDPAVGGEDGFGSSGRVDVFGTERFESAAEAIPGGDVRGQTVPEMHGSRRMTLLANDDR